MWEEGRQMIAHLHAHSTVLTPVPDALTHGTG